MLGLQLHLAPDQEEQNVVNMLATYSSNWIRDQLVSNKIDAWNEDSDDIVNEAANQLSILPDYIGKDWVPGVPYTEYTEYTGWKARSAVTWRMHPDYKDG